MRSAALALVALSGCWAWWVERTRDAAWLPRYREIWTYVRYQLPPHCRIGVSEAWAPYRYVLYGQDFANQLVVVSESAAAAGQLPNAVAAYYLVSLQGEAQRQEQLAGLARQGWQVVAVSKDRWGTLLVRPAGAP